MLKVELGQGWAQNIDLNAQEQEDTSMPACLLKKEEINGP